MASAPGGRLSVSPPGLGAPCPPPRSHPRRRQQRRSLSTLAIVAAVALALCIALCAPPVVSAQQTLTDYVTVTSPADPNTTPTPSSSSQQSDGRGSLNDAQTTRQVASSGATTPSAVSTSIPPLDFGSRSVPFLFQRPAATASVSKERPRVQTSFSGCSDDSLDLVEPQYRINISAVYSQFDPAQAAPHLSSDTSYTEGVLRIAGIGAIASQAQGASNGTFSAIQVQSRFLTFNIFSNLTYLCDELAPTRPDPANLLIGHTSCLYGPGTVGFGVSIPLNSTWPMGTIWTRVLLIDSSKPALAVSCIDVPVSRYDPARWYWTLYLWLPLALFIGFFVTVALARVITAAATRSRAFKHRAREGSSPSFLRDHINPIIISALSGQGMVLSPALLRYATPGSWEILFHLQFIAAIAMVSVRWPDFSYPFFARASWASLVGNVTFVQKLGQGSLVHPLSTMATLPTGDVGDQMSNASSPLYLNASAPQTLLNLDDAYTGIPAYARMIGLQSSDLFGTCLAIWLVIIAVFLAVALAGWVIDTIAIMASKIKRTREENGIDYHLADGPASAKGKSGDYVIDAEGNIRDVRSSTYGFLGTWTRGVHLSPRLHFAALHGNIVRALAMFHLPITIFSVYQFANGSAHTTRTVGFSIASFVLFSVLMPAWLLWRVAANPTRKLYDDIETLIALGPIYNVFSPGSQLFWAVTFVYSLALGVVVGAGYRSGSAQAIILLVLEVLLALATNLWLPWGEGAMMGPISFTTSVLRVMTAILVVLLAPIVGMSTQAASWITYVVLILQGIFFAGAAVILIFKLIEAVIRLCGRVTYDERVDARSGGIGGAIRQIRRRRDKILQLSKPRRPAKHSRHSTSSQQMMLSSGMLASRPNSLVGPPMMSAKSGTVSPIDPMSPFAHQSRQASFASYLDYGNAARASTPGMLGPSRSVHSGPYAAYFHHDGDDEDAEIMAAMPPTSPGPWGPASLPHATTADVDHRATFDGKAGGFERVGGGRATDSMPYNSLPGGAKDSKSAFRYGTGGASKGDGSSTAAAASFARAHSRREARTGNPTASQGIFMNRRQPVSTHYGGEAEEEDDPWAGTWGTSTLSSTQHGPWNGVAKMQAAIAAMRNRLAGRRPAPSSSGHHGLAEVEEEEAPSGGGGGFQVMRPPRQGGVRVAQEPSPAAEPQPQQPEAAARQDERQGRRVSAEPSWQRKDSEQMDSTAMAAATSTSRPPSSHGVLSTADAPRRPEAEGATGGSRPMSMGPSRAPTLQLSHLEGSALDLSSPSGTAARPRPASMLTSSALGILGADMQRAASEMGHDDAEEDARRRERNEEARYWQPSDRGTHGGEGEGGGAVRVGAERSPTLDASSDSRDTMGSRWAEALSARIELIDPSVTASEHK
ncbi:unnamed protein product [Parajaminaea phylloscopi]